MEKTLLTWSVPNMITVWLMLAIGFLVIALLCQFGLQLWPSNSQAPANNSGGY